MNLFICWTLEKNRVGGRADPLRFDDSCLETVTENPVKRKKKNSLLTVVLNKKKYLLDMTSRINARENSATEVFKQEWEYELVHVVKLLLNFTKNEPN